jgi:flagellar L-ring protein precursor FlgH
MKYPLKLCLTLTTCLFLPGCFAGRMLAEVGDRPALSKIQDPTLADSYRPVSMPMPYPEKQHMKVNSLWETGSRAFFKDQRAGKVGDILTVLVDIDDKAKFDNTTNLQRQPTSTMNVTNVMGLEGQLKNLFPKAVTPTPFINTNSNSQLSGTGKYDRKDQIKLKVAVTIIQVLPNGNLVIQGRQEVSLFNEMRIVDIAGIVRREDIKSDNTVPYEKLAEARIGYGGQGDVTDTSTFPIAMQVLNKISPW